MLWLGLLCGGFVAYFAYDLPSTDNLTGPKSGTSVTVLASDGSTLATYGSLWGEFLPVRVMSPVLPQAVVAIEDRRFYEHGGVDISSM